MSNAATDEDDFLNNDINPYDATGDRRQQPSDQRMLHKFIL
jgi:hypothetical protein